MQCVFSISFLALSGAATAQPSKKPNLGTQEVTSHWLIKSEPESRIEHGIDVKVSFTASGKIPYASETGGRQWRFSRLVQHRRFDPKSQQHVMLGWCQELPGVFTLTRALGHCRTNSTICWLPAYLNSVDASNGLCNTNFWPFVSRHAILCVTRWRLGTSVSSIIAIAKFLLLLV